MNLTQQLESLRRQEEVIKRQIENCQHDFHPARFDPEIKKEITYQTVARGSDIYPEPNGTREYQVDRWSRQCKKCGAVQYTYEQAPVIERYEPKFK